MLTADHITQLDDLLGMSIADFDISDNVYRLAVSRYEDLGAWLSDYWDASPDDGIVYPQGSFRLGTVVQPIYGTNEYDVDLVCRRDIAKASTTQESLKADCGNGIASYVASGPDGSPTRSEGKRCWTLNYQGEPFHVDVLPAIPTLTPAGIPSGSPTATYGCGNRPTRSTTRTGFTSACATSSSKCGRSWPSGWTSPTCRRGG